MLGPSGSFIMSLHFFELVTDQEQINLFSLFVRSATSNHVDIDNQYYLENGTHSQKKYKLHSSLSRSCASVLSLISQWLCTYNEFRIEN